MRSPSSIKEYRPGPQSVQCIWTALGLPSRGTRLHELVYEGLSFEYLDRIASALQMQRGVVSKAMGMSPATMARRRRAGRFNTVESDRLVALLSVLERAVCLFEGDLSAAKRWMCSPVRGLGSKCPIEMTGTRVETQAVLDFIGQLEKSILV
ncbi:MAG: antitoxin Xre-like helix-turn-helix domain-containing protein [Pseudomonas sp.]|uniref:antitoxin Xre-like helix-turn-helix domain-containing protein n=1 Tax=Pseudomonas sp. TaxID=306 RepID=UPI003D6E2460